jgi:hypothetical protein
MKTDRGSFRMGRHEQLLEQVVHDPYRPARKRPGPAVCPGCGAVWRRGRWRWEAAPPAAPRSKCPACLRVRDRLPAASVTLSGPFFAQHREEILAQVRNCERAEKADHPMQRIMRIAAGKSRAVVTTTDAHLARRIGDSVRRACEGTLEYRYQKRDNMLRVSWCR